MPLEEGLKFIEKLEERIQLIPTGTPEHPASMFSHPIIASTEGLIKGMDTRIEPYVLVEDEEERKRSLATSVGFDKFGVTLPGNQLPFKPDPRLILPYTGNLEDMKLLVGIVPDTYLVWKDTKERLFAAFAMPTGRQFTMRSSSREAHTVEGNSTAVYFENGVISCFSFYETRDLSIPVIQYFVPPNMNVSVGQIIKPPYRRLNDNLAYPRQLEDFNPIIRDFTERSGKRGLDYSLRQQMRNDMRTNAKLVMMFADAHKELYSI